MESAAYKDIVGRIEEIASHVRRQGMEGQRNDTACLLDSREVMRLLCVSRRTLQRLRDSKRIEYAIFRGACRYHLSEVERLVEESVIDGNPQRIEDFKRNYLLRTGGQKKKG